jgi:FMN phosphatase YigB (HAD superfamily)
MTQNRQYRAICFDLDGTLLPMDVDEFMSAYFKRIAAFVAARGLDPALFMQGLKEGTRAMAANMADEVNAVAFWRRFGQVYAGDAWTPELEAHVLQIAGQFYETDFAHVGDGFVADGASARVVCKLMQKGYPLMLTTMPMFPLVAVKHRLAWAGVDAAIFGRITNYENSKSIKPRLTYFAENLAAAGVRAQDVLMVGNNTMEDMAFLQLGADGYLITDWLLDPVDFDLSQIKHGSMADFEAWVDALPNCENPAGAIECGPIEAEATARVLRECGIDQAKLSSMNAKAMAVADAAAGDHTPGSAAKVKFGGGQ